MIGEEIHIFDWFKLHFVENEGMAFGMKLGGDYGKLILSSFRIIAVFFLIFILASTFTLLNLFIAVIVNAIQQERHSDGRPSIESELMRLHDEISPLREDLARHGGRLPETGQH